MPCVTSWAHRLDDLLLMVNDVLGIAVSRATLNRYLKPAAAKQKGAPLQGKKALKAGITPHTLELHHLPLSLHMDDGGEQHLLWAREPVSGWCYARLYAGLSPQRLNTWTQEVLAACPAAIQSIETFGFEATLAVNDIAVKAHQRTCSALQVMVPLRDIIPRVNVEPAGALLMTLCEFYNRGKAQKKLGKVRRRPFWKGCGASLKNVEHIFRRTPDARLAVCHHNWAFNELRIVNHRLHELSFSETRVVQVK
ncbi:Uncharacterised protein [Enterobacter cloacae]|uniref:Uncharacterized protein n=1 Tax=Enterobacter cloacae TaxID=550 RepID=A0A377LXT5_ENTCL|nr:Uncharacterised protein [Enterobacter cloacae]